MPSGTGIQPNREGRQQDDRPFGKLCNERLWCWLGDYRRRLDFQLRSFVVSHLLRLCVSYPEKLLMKRSAI